MFRNAFRRLTRTARKPVNAVKPRRLSNLLRLEDRVTPTVLSLFSAGATGTLNGAVYTEVISTTSTGTGIFDTFVQLQATGNEQGVNYDRSGDIGAPQNAQYNEGTSGQHNRFLALSSVPVVDVGGVLYRQFFLDNNQTNNNPYLSLNRMFVSISGTGNLQQAAPPAYDPTFGGAASLVYNLDGNGDNTLRTVSNELDNGSGKGDVEVLIPNSLFANAFPTAYVYLYSQFGLSPPAVAGDVVPVGTTFTTNDGFEEWAVKIPALTPTVTTLIHDAQHNVVTSVPAGTIVHDSATVTGSGATPTGFVTFTFYQDNAPFAVAGNEDVLLATSGQFNLVGGTVDATTFTQGPLTAGHYYFQATYSGDQFYIPGVMGDIEPLEVINVETTTTTAIHNETHGVVGGAVSVPLGSTVHDSATVTSLGGTPTGTVSFQFYLDVVPFALATDTAPGVGDTPIGASSGNLALVGGTVDATSYPQGPLAAGHYFFQATYTPSGGFTGSTSFLEPLTVDRAQLAITTIVHNADPAAPPHTVIGEGAHVPLGTSAHDTANVTGAVAGFPIPGVTFTFEGAAIANGAGEAGATANSINTGPLGANTAANPVYTFNATVASNDNYIGATSDPETFFVDRAQLEITTEVHNAVGHVVIPEGGHVPLGTSAHDTATVTGAVGGFAIPGVTFTFEGAAIANGAGEGAFTANTVNTGALGANTAANPLYTFNATVASNDNYIGRTSAPETFIVDRAQLEITTEVHNAVGHVVIPEGGHVPLGTSAHDTATVTGAVGGFAIPGVTFTFEGAAIANGAGEGAFTANTVNTGALGANTAANPLYTFNATVASNDNYIGRTSAPETFFVDRAQLEITTEVHNAVGHVVIPEGGHVPLGTSAHDTATVTGAVGGFAIPGVTFTFEGAAIANGAGEGAFTANTVNTGALGANTAANPLYTFNATVASNDNYIGRTSAPETFIVDRAQLEITTEVHNAVGHVVIPEGGHVPLGTSAHDTATVTGAVGGFAIPGVTFTFEGAAIANGAGEGAFTANTVNTGALGANTAANPLYTFNATVASNDNYIGRTSAPETFIVDRAQLEITTEVHNAVGHVVIPEGGHVPLGTSAHDTATVTGAVGGFAIPGVTFTFEGAAIANGAGEGAFTANTVNTGALGANTAANPLYTFNATVASNDNYIGRTSAPETFIVDRAQLEITTEVHNAVGHVVIPEGGHVPLGTSAHDTATVTGAVGGFAIPGVTFTFEGAAIANGAGEGAFTANTVNTGALGANTAANPLYTFNATVASNDNYIGRTSAPETFIVDRAQLEITTEVHNAVGHVVIPEGGHVPLGTSAHDTATVTGAVGGFAIPGVTFTFEGAAIANGAGEGAFTANTVNTGALGANTAANPLYTFNATVASNDNYIGRTSAPETFIVDRAQLEITTEVHNAVGHVVIPEGGHVPLGTSAHDTATVTGAVGGFAIPGVTFTFEGAAIANGAGEGAFTANTVNTGALGANTAANPLYTFNATVASNDNYIGRTSAPETFIVDRAQLEITTVVHDSGHNDITGGSIQLGSTAHDNATVTGAVAGFAIPGVTFTLNGNSIANGATEAPFTATTVDTDPLLAGNYVFVATVGSNDNYIGATGADEPFSVAFGGTVTGATVIHLQNGSVVPEGSTIPTNSIVYDTLTVTATPNTVIDLGGFANFTLYNDLDNSGGLTFGDTVRGTSGPIAMGPTTHGATATASANSGNFGPLPTGSYFFIATYSGGNYLNPNQTVESAAEPFKGAPTLTAATIGFWQNKNGAQVISALGTTGGFSNLGIWLANTYPRLYGSGITDVTAAAGASLANATPAEVQKYFVYLFSGFKDNAKVEAQVMAVAIAAYVTDSSLNTTAAGISTATGYGFLIIAGGLGGTSWNTGSAGTLLGLSNNTDYTIYQLLAAANTVASTSGRIYLGNANARGTIGGLFAAINEFYDI